MKKTIGLTFFIALVMGIIFSISDSSLGKRSTDGFNLAGLYSLNQAYAEDNVPKVQCVACWNEEITLPDGTKTIAHKVGCAGTGDLECKCPGHS